MLGLLLALSVLLLLWLLQAPHWFRAALFGLAAAAVAAFTVFAGGDLAVAPLLVLAMSLALLLPDAGASRRRIKVAPSKGTRIDARNRRRRVDAGNHEGIDVPGYELLEKVGSGGMATVYRARKMPGGRTVAIKVPMEQYSADERLIRRFHREAELAQRLSHPNIVRTFEHGTAGTRHYLVMEFVQGHSLEELIESGDLDFGLSVEIMKLVADALKHIHSAGIIHRDIKPANIMITGEGIRPEGSPRLAPDSVKLMDFGIAGGNLLTKLTATGARIGTPVYMSPEQARGDRIDHRGDIYSLGLVFYEMLTGQTAFRGGYDAVVHQQIFQDPPPPRQLKPEVPWRLDELVMRMVSKEPSDRPTLEEVSDVLTDPTVLSAPLQYRGDRLVLSASSSKAALRVLDTDGNLLAGLGDIGPDANSLPAAPLALTVDPEGEIFAALLEYGGDGNSTATVLRLPAGGGPEPVVANGSGGWPRQPLSLAVSLDGMSLYVLDGSRVAVSAFDRGGRCLFSFGGPGQEKGQFDDPRVVATAPSGEIYVLDFGNRRVQRFDSQGVFRGQLQLKAGEGGEARVLDGLTVDREGNVYLSDRQTARIRKFGTDGRQLTTFQLAKGPGNDDGLAPQLVDLAVDASGYLYAARRGGRRIEKFLSTGGTAVAVLDAYVPIVHMTIDPKRVEG